jgi:hypothetical protein
MNSTKIENITIDPMMLMPLGVLLGGIADTRSPAA